jgi:hypothetical protein
MYYVPVVILDTTYVHTHAFIPACVCVCVYEQTDVTYAV